MKFYCLAEDDGVGGGEGWSRSMRSTTMLRTSEQPPNPKGILDLRRLTLEAAMKTEAGAK
jgi:hypothetical protein